MRHDPEARERPVTSSPVRRIRMSITDWLQNRLITALHVTLDEHTQELAELNARLNRLTRRVRSTEAKMSGLSDFLVSFRGEVNAQTNRISGQLADLQARLAAGDEAAVTEVSDALSPIITDLQAIGSGTHADPLPADPGETADTPPADGSV
jgi:uncharacterized coiled-coil protein SlyX